MTSHPGRWQILTGEYPPHGGGVADYTRLVARGLAEAGADVHVWGPEGGNEEDESPGSGVTVHRVAGRWSSADLGRMGRDLDVFEPPRRILVEYAPNAFGYKGLNLGLGRWLVGRRRAGDHVRVMFHEVTYIAKPGDPVRRRLLAFGQRRLAALLLRAADAVDVAIPYWERMLRPLDPVAGRAYDWRPIPSTVPVIHDPEAAAATRRRMATAGVATLIGSFGTFAADVAAMLSASMLPLLLGRPDRAALLIGRGSERAAAAWLGAHPELTGRVVATGPCASEQVPRHLEACDLLLQPYPGGVCAKRSSLMAGIAHGVATATTVGDVTEPIWAETGSVALAPENDGATLTRRAEALLADPDARARLGRAGRALYEDRFALRYTIDALLGIRPPREALRA